MRVEIANETRWRIPRLRLQAVARRAERVFHLPRTAQVTITFVTDSTMQRLNKKAMGQNRPTDVLAFPLHTIRSARTQTFSKLPADPDGTVRLGDIMISVATARVQARALGHSVSDEVTELFAHGLLHLLGYDHARKSDATRMAGLAERLLT